MFMRNVFVAAVSLQALVEGVVAQEKVTLTKYVTKAKAKATNAYPVPDLPEPEVTVVPTSYIEDGTTIFVDETVTIPCSRCTASTAGDADAEATSEAEVISTVITTDAGDVSDQTAEVTVVPTSYIEDGTTIFVDETITIPCTKCAGGKKTETEAGAEETSEAAVETEVTTGDALAQGTSSEVAETLSTDAAEATESGDVPAQTAEVTVIPTSYITDGTTIFVDETVTIPCTKCAGGKGTETVPAEGAEETTTGADLEASTALGVATSEAPEEETTAATEGAAESTPVENDTQTANTATEEVDASTEAEIPIPTTIIPSVILTTGNSQNTVTSQPGPFANTTVTAPAVADTTAIDELPASSEVATSSAVVSKIVKPVIVVIREVTIFHRTIVIGAACPPVKRGNKGDFVVGTGSDEKSFTKIDEALDDACGKQAKACAESAGKNYAVTDCQKQLEICRADASSTAKAPTGDMKESTETATVILPSDAAVTTGKDNKPAVGGHVVISTRTLTVSESCVVSDGTPVIETPASTDASATTVQTADAETTDAEFEASTALGVATSEVPEVPENSDVVSTLTLTKPNGEVTVTSMTLTNGVPTGTGVYPVPPAEETTAEAPAETTEAAFETTSDAEFEASTALGVATSEVPEVPDHVTTLTLTKPNGEVTVTSMTLTNGVPTGTGVYPVPPAAETSEAPVESMPVVETPSAAETTAEAEVSSALGVETSEEASTVVTGTQTGVVVITMTKPNGEVSVTSMTITPGVPTGTGTAIVTVPAEETTAEAPAETSEAAVETTIVPGGQETTVVGEKTITHTVTNEITSYVTVGVDTVTEGTETITKTLTNEVTQTVTVPAEEITKTVTLPGGGEITKTVTVPGEGEVVKTVTLPCEQGANVVTSVVSVCPPPTTLATASTKAPETVYVTATVEAQNTKPSPYPVPGRFRRMLGL
ncbi:hypothetical protein FPOAC2_03576 [Fusarium poae]|jgi:hypothetical protein|uniref:Uncharacterized protein n=1 Tax=Fusarium poae TaxID=36050 RepID=A0A1B8B9F5_FUSPO|nr:hypothetical protein FPOAC1_003534 [Fusarium poae]KAG8677511.1 hypothetical protein FPOAC1_003534 [Fusarium poae]OBS29359.1 hypothetical protein FPOA_03295 [Fusarium poae]